MTAAQQAKRRVARRVSILSGSALLVLAATGWTVASTRADAVNSSDAIIPAKAAELVDATSGTHSVQLQAIGEQAKVINAAMPFSSGPVTSARPFFVSGDEVDERRALLCLTQAVYYEAGFEPLAGRRAVAQVVLNRVRHAAFPKSICGVVYQGSRTGVCQFTFVCDGALYRAPESGAWEQAKAIAKAALAGYVERSVGEATHYHADYVAPRWAPLLAKVRQIGAHIFYRWPGSWGQPQAFAGRYIGEPADPASLRPARVYLASSSASSPDSKKPVYDGPPIARAPNDVGGLLDTSKGWTLNIPDPRETRSAASQVLAAQQQIKPAAPVAVASAAVPAGAAR